MNLTIITISIVTIAILLITTTSNAVTTTVSTSAFLTGHLIRVLVNNILLLSPLSPWLALSGEFVGSTSA